MPIILTCDLCRQMYKSSDLSHVEIEPPHYQELPEPSAENYVDIRDEDYPEDRVIRLHYCEMCLDELELPPVKPESDPDLAPEPYDLGDDMRADGGVPAWAERTDDGRIRCTVCGNEADELPVDHDCIYQNDLVADGSGERGLYPKYDVEKDGEPVDGCFVLEPENDPAAREALLTYAAETDNATLSEDIRYWVEHFLPVTDAKGGEQ